MANKLVKAFNRVAAPIADRFYKKVTIKKTKVKLRDEGSYTYITFPDNITLKFPKGEELADFANVQNYFYNSSLSEGDTVVDAGAYVGVFSLYAAKKVGDKGKVIAFEPDEDSYKKLCKNIELNGVKNVVLIKKGLWNENGTKEFFSYKASSSIVNNFLGLGEKVKIDVTTLDSAVKEIQLKKIDFIKMDIEGAEIEALSGMENVLKDIRRLAIASYHKRNGEKTCSVIERVLREKGYTCITPESNHLTTHAYK